jgi:methionyl aminopeptidase
VIHLRSPREIEHIRASCQIVVEALDAVRRAVSPGVTTAELERIIEKVIADHGATSAFKGYRGYPASACISVNEEVVHGIPGSRRLREGDIVSVDVGVKMNGYYGDGATTIPVGEVSPEVRRLLDVTEEALYQAIAQARPRKRLFDISSTIQGWAESHGFSVVREFVGHGLGRYLHEDPQIPNFGESGKGPRLMKGMVLAIEPMINMGGAEVRVLEDKWTAVTVDGLPSAHFEHTVVIADDEAEILTQPG